LQKIPTQDLEAVGRSRIFRYGLPAKLGKNFLQFSIGLRHFPRMPAKEKRRKTTVNQSDKSRGNSLIPENIAPLVLFTRHERVLLDSDLAELYGVTTVV